MRGASSNASSNLEVGSEKSKNLSCWFIFAKQFFPTQANPTKEMFGYLSELSSSSCVERAMMCNREAGFPAYHWCTEALYRIALFFIPWPQLWIERGFIATNLISNYSFRSYCNSKNPRARKIEDIGMNNWWVASKLVLFINSEWINIFVLVQY